MHIKSGVASKILEVFTERDENTKLMNFMKKKFGNSFGCKRIQGKQVNQLIEDEGMIKCLFEDQKPVWLAFVDVVRGFLGKNRASNYKILVQKLMNSLKQHKVPMTLKIHLLDSHINEFPEDCSAFSDESGERHHQDLKVC